MQLFPSVKLVKNGIVCLLSVEMQYDQRYFFFLLNNQTEQTKGRTKRKLLLSFLKKYETGMNDEQNSDEMAIWFSCFLLLLITGIRQNEK